MELTQNNISTLTTMIYGTILLPILNGLGYVIDQQIGMAICSAIVMLALLIWNAKNPNTLSIFNNEEPIIEDIDPASEYEEQ